MRGIQHAHVAECIFAVKQRIACCAEPVRDLITYHQTQANSGKLIGPIWWGLTVAPRALLRMVAIGMHRSRCVYVCVSQLVITNYELLLVCVARS